MSINFQAEAVQSEEWCEKQWVSASAMLLSGTNPNGAAMLKQWHSYEAQCGLTFTYVGRLALIQIFMKDFTAAKATLAKASKASSPFAYSLDAAKIQLEIQERISQPKPITKQELIQFEASYVTLVKKYPNWPTGFALLGGMQTLLGKHIDAIRNLEVAKSSDTYELSGVYRNLTISRAATGEFQLALESADKAFALNTALTSDSAFAYALANADSALGHLDDAETILKVILAKHPEVRSDPEFIHAVEFYREQRSRRTKN
jgi:tetratricopeptide (TPR) repeat protein